MLGNARTHATLLAFLTEKLSSDFEAKQLLCFVTGMTNSRLILEKNSPTTPEQVKQCLTLCERRTNGEPLQYLLGEWEFYGLPLYVGDGVLIPRADTERLVDIARELLTGNAQPELLDLCSGSGCIALALAKTIPNAAVTAVELSTSAYSYLTRNIQRNNLSVLPVQADIFTYTHPRSAHLITANPPYIPHRELDTLQIEVGHEPQLALCGGEDGLDFYRIIAKRYLPQLLPNGYICLEVGIGQSDDVSKLLDENHFTAISVHRDIAGINRVVTAQRPDLGRCPNPQTF